MWAADEYLRIVVIGTLAPVKGLRVVREVAQVMKRHRSKMWLQVVGEPTEDRDALEAAGVYISGHYQDAGLGTLLTALAPHVAWFPCQVPETYSFALSQALRFRMPVVAADLGSFPERLAGRDWTWLAPWDREPLEWVSLFEELRENHFLAGVGHVAPGVPLISDDFYAERYLQVGAVPQFVGRRPEMASATRKTSGLSRRGVPPKVRILT